MASDVDVSALTEPISADAPCGEDLEYDPAFLELVQAAEGSDEVAVGESVLEAREPDWRDVRKRAEALMERTRDLRVAMYLAMAELRLQGLAGFCRGLALVAGLLRECWDGVHPQLDPDDGYDPTMRLNAIEGLRSESGFLPALRAAPVASSGSARKFTFRELLAVRGLLEGVSLGEEQDGIRSELERALAGDPAAAGASAAELDRAMELIGQIDAELMERVGAGAALDFSPLTTLLERMRSSLGDVEPVALEAGAEPMDDGQGGLEEPAAVEAGGGASSSAGAARPGLPAALGSREEVLRAMQLICDYYERHEPASPVPLLVGRAKRLASMSFLQIVQEMAPEGMQQVRFIGGVREEEDEEET